MTWLDRAFGRRSPPAGEKTASRCDAVAAAHRRTVREQGVRDLPGPDASAEEYLEAARAALERLRRIEI